MQDQFSNKEINVRRHGNLVQLILTPSSSTKIRNALTLQVSTFALRQSRNCFKLLNVLLLMIGDARIQRGSVDIKKR